MSTYTRIGRAAKSCGIGLHHPQTTKNESDTAKKKWVQKYSRRLLRLWLHRHPPFGVARTYVEHIKKCLAECYEDPLKKVFIETTYH